MQEWKQATFEPEPAGSDGVGVIVVPASRAAEMTRIRTAAEDAVLHQIWADSGYNPLISSVERGGGDTTTETQTARAPMSLEDARELAEQHAPPYYRLEQIPDEQIVADWTHWRDNNDTLPTASVHQEWARHLGRVDELDAAADAAEAQLREQVSDPPEQQLRTVRLDAIATKGEEIWATSSRIDLDQAKQLAEQHAPAYYNAPDIETLQQDWQAFVNDGELPLERRQEAWANYAGDRQSTSLDAWTDPDTGEVDLDGRAQLLAQVREDGRQERAALEYADAVAGVEAAAADAREAEPARSAAWERVHASLAEHVPDAEDLSGDAEHAATIYTPLLDPAAFAAAEQPEAARAWLAAYTWASEDNAPAAAAAAQLGQAYIHRFGVDPATGEAVDAATGERSQPAPAGEPDDTTSTGTGSNPSEPAPSTPHGPPSRETPPATTQVKVAGRTLPTLQDQEQATGGRGGTGQTSRARIVELHEQAQEFYASRYPDSPAQKHLRDRFGPDVETKGGLTVGYAPAGWRNLSDHLRRSGASEAELIDAGLAGRTSQGRLYDRFRDRVTIAVRDHRDGAIVGFTARDLSGDEKAPKYLNTAATAAFRKGHLLIGHHEAQTNGADRLVRVEGAMDVLAINLAGDGAVAGAAPMGTALTSEQAELLAAATADNTVLEALDNDTAGDEARATDVIQLADFGTSLRQVPHGGEDPADTWQKNPDTLRQALRTPDPEPSVRTTISRVLVEHTEHIVDVDARYRAAAAVAPVMAAAPRADQASSLSYAARFMSALSEVTPEPLNVADARMLLQQASEYELHPSAWARGTSLETLTADLASDVEAAHAETAATEQEQPQQPTADAPVTMPQASEPAAPQPMQDDARRASAPITAAPRPAIYDRATQTPSPEGVSDAGRTARQRAGAGFTTTTAAAVGAAQTRRARLPRKTARNVTSQPRRVRDTGLGR